MRNSPSSDSHVFVPSQKPLISISFPEAAILLVSDGDHMTKGTPEDEVALIYDFGSNARDR